MGFITSEGCDQSIEIMIVRYLWCAVARGAMTLGLASISWLWKSRDGQSLCLSYVCVATPKAVVNSPLFAGADF